LCNIVKKKRPSKGAITRIMINLTAAQVVLIRSLAHRDGLTMSAWVRLAAIQKATQ
jgi:hypothetical protein